MPGGKGAWAIATDEKSAKGGATSASEGRLDICSSPFRNSERTATSQVSLGHAKCAGHMVCRRSARAPHDRAPESLFRQETNFLESTKLPQAHKTALNER